jgi:hypothetical protein
MGENEIVEGIKNLSPEQRESVGRKIVKGLYFNNKEKGVLDSIQEKIVSRKLLVFIVSTALLAFSTLDPDSWSMIALIYIGGQSAVDIAKIWKGA